MLKRREKKNPEEKKQKTNHKNQNHPQPLECDTAHLC